MRGELAGTIQGIRIHFYGEPAICEWLTNHCNARFKTPAAGPHDPTADASFSIKTLLETAGSIHPGIPVREGFMPEITIREPKSMGLVRPGFKIMIALDFRFKSGNSCVLWDGHIYKENQPADYRFFGESECSIKQ